MTIGFDAIEMKRVNSEVTLNKYADPIEGERFDLTIEEAEDIASVDPSLIYFEPSETMTRLI